MPSRLATIKMYVTSEEYEEISASAKRVGLSRSTYIKRICLGLPTPSLEKQHARRDLLKAHADLGRLGGLFKLCLSEKQGSLVALHQEVRRILREIEIRQRELKTAISII